MSSAPLSLCPEFGLWVLSSGAHTLQPSSAIEWSRVPWLRVLYGTIFQPSTADSSVASWISSLRASLARETASQESAPASTTNDGCGPSCGESSSSAEPGGCSSRTSPESSTSTAAPRSRRSSTRWPRAGGLRNGTVSQREPSAPRTSAIVGSCSLPTPTASDYGSSQNGINGVGGENERPSAGRPSLGTAARTGQLSAAVQALRARGSIPTVTANDAKAGGVAGNWTEESGRHSGTTLTDLVVRKVDSKRGATSRGSLQRGESTGTGGGVLSPRFVEWMMGWPPGWVQTTHTVLPSRRSTQTRSSCSETASSPTPQLSLFASPGNDSTGGNSNQTPTENTCDARE